MYRNAPTKHTASQNLASGALSTTYTMTKSGFYHWCGIKFSGNVTETVTVKFDSADGVNYDITLDTSNLTAAANYAHKPSHPLFLKAGDAITITCTKATATETAYVTAFFEEVPTWA